MQSLRPDQVEQIHEYIHNQQLINAIKLYREATGVGLAEAKEAVEAMARDEYSKPQSGTLDFDNPILEARIISLLKNREKIQAVRIYRDEYGVGLKEAKDAVDRIESTMRGEGLSMNVSPSSAFGDNPFADDAGSRGRVIAIAIAVAVFLMGVGMFFLVRP